MACSACRRPDSSANGVEEGIGWERFALPGPGLDWKAKAVIVAEQVTRDTIPTTRSQPEAFCRIGTSITPGACFRLAEERCSKNGRAAIMAARRRKGNHQ